MRRTGLAPRAPWRGRTDRCPRCADPPRRNASRRRRALPSVRPWNSTCWDDPYPLHWSRAPSRCAGVWRCSSAPIRARTSGLARETSGKAHYNDLMLALRYVYLLALVVWLGGMVVLGALVAPATFQVLQAAAPDTGRALAGELFGVILARLHYLAYGAGGILFITLALMAILGPRPAGFAIRLGIIVVMLGVAGYSGIRVLGEIDGIQQSVHTLPS